MKSKTTTIKCGTCEFWTGKRAPIFDVNNNPVVDIIDSFGECQNVNSRFCDKKARTKSKMHTFLKVDRIILNVCINLRKTNIFI